MSGEFPTLVEVLRRHRLSFIKHGCLCDDPGPIDEWADHVEQVWAEACTIRKVADLDALPEQSVVRNIAFGVVFESAVENDGSVIWRSPNGLEKSTVMLPALLVWHPDWTQS
jgi:hypothetical protein